MRIIITTITISLLLVGLVIVNPTQDSRASIGSEEFCNDNPGHFACDNENDNDENDNEIPDRDEECENPPDAASCNNENNDVVNEEGEYTRNTTPYDANKNTLPTGKGCYDAGYDDGKNGPFDREIYYDDCSGEGQYMDGFIDGCMKVGNTKSVCESATDA